MGILTIFGAVLGGVIIHLVACEMYEKAPAIARWLVKRATRRLPSDARERYEEEWLAHLCECAGGLTKIAHAIECLFAARSLRKFLLRPDAATLTMTRDTKTLRWSVASFGEQLEIDLATAQFFFAGLQEIIAKTGTPGQVKELEKIFRTFPELRNSSGIPDPGELRKISNLLGDPISRAGTGGPEKFDR